MTVFPSASDVIRQSVEAWVSVMPPAQAKADVVIVTLLGLIDALAEGDRIVGVCTDDATTATGADQPDTPSTEPSCWAKA